MTYLPFIDFSLLTTREVSDLFDLANAKAVHDHRALTNNDDISFLLFTELEERERISNGYSDRYVAEYIEG